MTDRGLGTESPDHGPTDPVADAVVHGLLAALAARERRMTVEPVAPRRRRRFLPVAAAASILAAAAVFFALIDRAPSASAASVITSAIAHAAGPGTRVYDAVIDPEGDGLGRVPIEGRVFIEGGSAPRVAAVFGVGPLRRLVRFGHDPLGAWLQSPSGVKRGVDGAPMIAEWFGGLDDRVLRIDKILERCSTGYEISLTAHADGLQRLEAVRQGGVSAPIVEAEFRVRPGDGAVVHAWIAIESRGGARAEITLELDDGAVATDADLSP